MLQCEREEGAIETWMGEGNVEEYGNMKKGESSAKNPTGNGMEREGGRGGENEAEREREGGLE